MKVNGDDIPFQTGQTVLELLQSSGYDPQRVAVERNGKILPKGEFSSAFLDEADSLEVVSFVGGG